ncbi:SDR family oxidoreductase [uncultured Tateyamaria sp.]|uniref:SDR family oxidoreductase n=1 Tax=uncultured Tateyamaria sp. TaxID=455651 RepID=UPI00345CF291
MKNIEAKLGATNVLIHNASVMRSASPLDLTSDELRREIEVNFVGAFATSRAVAPAMLKRGLARCSLSGAGSRLSVPRMDVARRRKSGVTKPCIVPLQRPFAQWCPCIVHRCVRYRRAGWSLRSRRDRKRILGDCDHIKGSRG